MSIKLEDMLKKTAEKEKGMEKIKLEQQYEIEDKLELKQKKLEKVQTNKSMLVLKQK